MKKFVNFVKKPIVWVTTLIVFVIGGIAAIVFGTKNKHSD